MALVAPPSQTQRPTSPAPSMNEIEQAPVGHRLLRGTITVLAAVVMLTTIQGAIFVVPTMPRAWLHQGLVSPFADYTIPALALGILCGGGALLAVVSVLMWPRVGAVVSIIAGILMVGFELVEIVVVGFTPVLYPTQVYGWLQVFYLAMGSAIALFGWLLWKKVETATLSRG
jgi:hypothetical protein